MVSLGAYAVSRDRRTSAILPGLACLFFTVAAVSNFHEGTQWIDSRGLHDDFVSAVLRLSPPVDSVFLVGAPRYLRRAPAFNLRHDVITAAARALGRPLDNGDNEASPTRRGVVYYNDLTLLPAEYFRWIPATEVNLISFDAANRAFTCVSSLRVESPDGLSQDLPLRPNKNCSLILPMEADAYLVTSVPGPAMRRRADAPRAAGLALLSAAASVRGETTSLKLEWRIETPPQATLAFIPRLMDASGNLLLDSVFPSRGGKRPYPMIWPLIDDLASSLHLRPGQTLHQNFLLRRAVRSLTSSAVLELDVFELAPAGNAVSRGSVTLPLAIKR